MLKEVAFSVFELRAILLRKLHNFFGWETTEGVGHEGYATCMVCGLNFRA